jgi:hypothetical protein
MGNDRREFLKQVGGATLAVAATAALADRTAPSAAAQEVVVGGARIKRAYVTSRCLLELEGQNCGWLRYAEGGTATAEIVEEPAGANGVARKGLGPVRYENLICFCGADLGQPFYDWLKTLFSRQPVRKSGAIVYLNAAGREVSRLIFTNALITEVGFPTLDVGWKQPAYLTIQLYPESTRLTREGAGRLFNVAAPQPPQWLASDFRLSLDGLAELPGARLWVEPVVVSLRAMPTLAGVRAAGDKEFATLGISDLVVTLPAAASQSLETWFEDFVLKGNNADEQEKNGTLELLSLDQREALFTLTFEHLGIYRLEPFLFDAGSGPSQFLQARMYCENVRLSCRPARG